MAFIVDGSSNVISFADFSDVVQKDQRILESNKIKIPAESGFADTTDFIEDMLQKSTDRILLKIKASSWWQSYNAYVGNPISDLSALPNVNPTLIDLFTELLMMADWYDFDNDGTVQADEKAYSFTKKRRSRSRSSIGYVR